MGATQPASLAPCGEGVALPGPPFACSATATGRNLDNEELDLSGRLTLSQAPCEEEGAAAAAACPSACLPASALQGLCPPGAYEYVYRVQGTTVSRSRVVLVTAKAAISLELLFEAPVPIPAPVIPTLQVTRTNRQQSPSEAASRGQSCYYIRLSVLIYYT